MSSLSTHVLDTAHGCPAEGVALELTDATGVVLFTGTTNADGRCPGIPALDPGTYALTFAVAERWARFQLRAGSVVNPFTQPALGAFRCPLTL